MGWEEILEVLKEEKEYFQNILYENVKKKSNFKMQDKRTVSGLNVAINK